MQAQGGLGICGGIGSRLCDRHLRHRALVLARADQFLDVGHALAQPGAGQVLQSQVARTGIEHPFGHHRVEGQWCHADAVARQHDEIVFQVMPDFGDAGIRQRTAQGGNDLFERQLRPGVVPDRDVIPFAVL